MKRTASLLGALMFLTFCAYSQKKLIGTNNVAMNPSGAITFIDSNEYIYNSWEGSLFEHKPDYVYIDHNYLLGYLEPMIRYNTRNLYLGNSMPISLSQTWNNTIVDTLITVSEWSSERFTFQYDADGNMVNKKKYVHNGTTYIIDYENIYEYNTNNDNTYIESINYSSGSPVTEKIDSMFFNASDQFVKGIVYVSDGAGGFYASKQNLIVYTGAILDYIDVYVGTSSSPLTWMNQVEYNFVSGNLVNIESRAVSGGVVQPTIITEYEYNYNANDELVVWEIILNGTPAYQVDYFYDSDGFIVKIIYQELDPVSSNLYVSSIRDLYHQNTADIAKIEMEEATIFPNPATDYVTISTLQNIEKVFIYDENGRLILTQRENEVEVSNLPAGNYRVMLKTSSGEAQGSFVKY